MPLGDKSSTEAVSIFDTYSNGVKTNRDSWVYNFSKQELISNTRRMITFFNEQVDAYRLAYGSLSKSDRPDAETFASKDSRKISWSRGLREDLVRCVNRPFNDQLVFPSMYRPFCKQWLYLDKNFNDMVYQIPRLFPAPGLRNLAISLTGLGASRDFSALMVDSIPNLHLHDTGQCFPLYRYINEDKREPSLFTGGSPYLRKDAISDEALKEFRKQYESKLSREDVFYYCYGVLHSPEYKERFASDMKKVLPRIPFTKDFWAFSKAGRKLAKWHLEYETTEPYSVDESAPQARLSAKDRYRVTKMAFGKKDGKPDKSVIAYNSHVTLSGIPLEAYEYVVNGKPALEWIMERYQVTVDKDSGITNDPNEWSDDPRYILDLVKRITRVSVETIRIVKSLPALNESTGPVHAVI